jgi:hypothetical protein
LADHGAPARSPGDEKLLLATHQKYLNLPSETTPGAVFLQWVRLRYSKISIQRKQSQAHQRRNMESGSISQTAIRKILPEIVIHPASIQIDGNGKSSPVAAVVPGLSLAKQLLRNSLAHKLALSLAVTLLFRHVGLAACQRSKSKVLILGVIREDNPTVKLARILTLVKIRRAQ